MECTISARDRSRRNTQFEVTSRLEDSEQQQTKIVGGGGGRGRDEKDEGGKKAGYQHEGWMKRAHICSSSGIRVKTVKIAQWNGEDIEIKWEQIRYRDL